MLVSVMSLICSTAQKVGPMFINEYKPLFRQYYITNYYVVLHNETHNRLTQQQTNILNLNL